MIAADNPLPLVDSHAHLDGPDFAEDFPEVLERARAAGVLRILTVGTELGTSRAALALAQAHRELYAAVGVHPHEAGKFSGGDWPAIRALHGEPKVVAVGETGLDYHYDFSPPEVQRALFRRHLELAGELRRPVVIHVREAFEDAFALLDEVGVPGGGVLHCFSGGRPEAERALGLGLHISLAGVITFPKATALREAATWVPEGRLLVETDAPYLAPVPRRGRRNEPALVAYTLRCLAELRGVEPGHLAEQTSRNADRLFGLDLHEAELFASRRSTT
ncbi:MAG: TatD family hydrolase [Deltaproteobacteria bacterium]|nr:TatD family hydrolase [Deltaproteobacteria bacterium]